MRAKIKKTGEIVDVVIYVTPNEQGFQYKVPDGRDRWRLYREDELDFEDLTDWNAFRRETAKEVLSRIIVVEDGVYPDPDEAAGMAVVYTDTLIELLKQK